MQVGFGAMHEADTERLTMAKQLGVPNIIIHTPQFRREGYWDFTDLLMLRTRVESFGAQAARHRVFPGELLRQGDAGCAGAR